MSPGFGLWSSVSSPNRFYFEISMSDYGTLTVEDIEGPTTDSVSIESRTLFCCMMLAYTGVGVSLDRL